MGKLIGDLIAQGTLDLKQMAEHVLKAESEEDTGICRKILHPPWLAHS